MNKLRARIAFYRADKRRDRGDFASAANLYRQGVTFSPKAFGYWVQYGNMLKEIREFAAAEAAYMKALDLQPNDADLHVQLGHLHNLKQDIDQARNSYRKAVAMGSNDPHALDFLKRIEADFNGSAARITPDSAQFWLTPLFIGLLGREPEAEAIEALKNRAATEQVTVPQLCSDIICGPEFAVRASQIPMIANHIASQSQTSGASDQIVLLIHDLIAARLEDRGCRWTVPPISSNGETMSVNEVAGLVRTLNMLGDQQSSQVDRNVA